jgi:hypothetical protein
MPSAREADLCPFVTLFLLREPLKPIVDDRSRTIPVEDEDSVVAYLLKDSGVPVLFFF